MQQDNSFYWATELKSQKEIFPLAKISYFFNA
jgi:hypothetical protein